MIGLLPFLLLLAGPALAPPPLPPKNPWGLREDWTTPARATTHLPDRAVPLVLETVERGGFVRQLVCLQWRPADPIYLYVIRPKQVVRPPVCLFLYSYPQSAQPRFTNDAYCERITARGCAVVGFESALTGERFRMRPLKEWFVSELPEALATSAHDVQFILDYLQTRRDLDTSRVGMFGQGSGGSIAILAAAVDARIGVVDLYIPWADWPRWLKESALITDAGERARLSAPAFTAKTAPLEPLRFLPRLRGRSVRLTLLADEPTLPAACQEELAAVAARAGAQVRRFERNSAFLAAVSGGKLFDWLGEQLSAPARSKVRRPAQN